MKCSRIQHRPHDRHGYVLLMTLVLIALAGLAMAGLARHSLLLAVEALEAREDLQRRWGSVCCQQVLLARAEAILSAHLAYAAEEEAPRAKLVGRLQLGDLQFAWQLADEDAKVNVNTLYREIDESQVRQVVNELSGTQNAIRLRPDLTSLPSGRLAFQSWGQVFAYGLMADSGATATSMAAATDELTCWGSGRLNVRRASERALAEVAGLAVTRQETQRLSEALAENPEQPVAQVINGLGLRGSRRRRLARLVTDRSGSYSLWITIGTSVTEQYELQLAETAVGGAQFTRFTW